MSNRTVLKAFQMSDEEIYAAASSGLAVAAYVEDTGVLPEMHDVRELTDHELDREIPEYDENEAPTGQMTTLRRYLNEMTGPGFLAGTL